LIFVYCFKSRSSIHLYEIATIAGEGLQNLGLCSALRAFEQGLQNTCEALKQIIDVIEIIEFLKFQGTFFILLY
jgi:hypothetical protein